MEAMVNEHIRKWISKLHDKKASMNRWEIQEDLSHSLPFLTLDIITHLCLGNSFDCLEKDADPYGFLAAMQSGAVAQQYLSSLLEIKSFLFFLSGFSFIRSQLFPNLNDKAGIGRVMMVRLLIKILC